MCVCVRVCACVRACARVCVCLCMCVCVHNMRVCVFCNTLFPNFITNDVSHSASILCCNDELKIVQSITQINDINLINMGLFK